MPNLWRFEPTMEWAIKELEYQAETHTDEAAKAFVAGNEKKASYNLTAAEIKSQLAKAWKSHMEGAPHA